MSDMPVFGDFFRQYFNPDTEVVEVRRRSRGQALISISELMELIGKLMKQHQLTFIPSKTEKNLILFPYAFGRPEEGDKIVNNNTEEVYIIDQIILNPRTGRWNGLVKMDLLNPPSIEERHTLSYLKEANYVNFDHIYPESLANIIGTNSEELLKVVPPMRPTITWNLVKIEPGGLGKPFDSRKELKPRLRESFKDPLAPGYTVQVLGKTFDNIVQFDSWSNDHRTSDKLIRWFENFLNSYSSYFRQCGVGQFFFWQRKEDDLNKTWRQTFAVKSTQYYVKTEELEANYERDIVNVNIAIQAVFSKQNPIFSEKRYIADQLVTGQLSEDDYYRLFYYSGQYQFGDIDIIQ